MREAQYMSIETLPSDAELRSPGSTGNYGYGSDVWADHSRSQGENGFTQWVIYQNGTLPTKVWRLPPLVCKIIDQIYKDRFEQGEADAQRVIRAALGFDEDGQLK